MGVSRGQESGMWKAGSGKHICSSFRNTLFSGHQCSKGYAGYDYN